MTCNCTEHSPFRWAERKRSSIFADDVNFRTKDGKTASQIATDVVARKRQENANHGTIYGLAKEREDAVIRSKLFHVYSKAGVK
jgi:hypothetical protein